MCTMVSPFLSFVGSEAYFYSEYGEKMDLDFLHDFLSKEFYYLGPKTNVGKCQHTIICWKRRCPEIFSTIILSLHLIQEGKLSVSGERMCTILVNRLEY